MNSLCDCLPKFHISSVHITRLFGIITSMSYAQSPRFLLMMRAARKVPPPPWIPFADQMAKTVVSVLPSHDIFIGVLWHPKLKKGIERVGPNFRLFSQILLHVSDRVTKLPGTGDCRSRATVVSWGCVQEANLVMEWFRPALSRLGLVIRLRLVSVLNGQHCLLSILWTLDMKSPPAH